MTLRYFTILLFCLFIYPSATYAQNCTAPVLSQQFGLLPTQVNFAFTSSGMDSGLAELVPQGQTFDNPTVRGIAGNKVIFQSLTPATTYTWRARYDCPTGGTSDWSPIYTFSTPALCPLPPVMTFDSVITIHFPAAPNPNLDFSNCGTPIEGNGYIFRYTIPVTGDYRISILEASGGEVLSGVSNSPGNYCYTGLTCWSNTSEAGAFRNLTAMSSGAQLVFVFSAAEGVTATRSILLNYQPCPALVASQLSVDTIKPRFVQLFATGYRMDIELTPDADTFSGIPDYTDIPGGFITFDNLVPGTSYRWQGRLNCFVNTSTWTEGTPFSTPFPCDSIPVLHCDSVYGGFPAGAGRLKMLRYRPEISHKLVFIMDFPEESAGNSLTVALRDSALGDCFSSQWPVTGWPVYRCCRTGMDTLSLGYVEAGKTYFLYANKAALSALPGSLYWECAGACPAPGKFKAKAIDLHTVTLGWHNNEWSNNWEIEIQSAENQFTGDAQYIGSGDSVIVPGLLPNTKYYWKIRNICSEESAGEWSDVQNFFMPLDCSDAPQINCDVYVQATNLSRLSLLDNCLNQSNGAERFYHFTPAYSGVFQLRSDKYSVNYLIQPLSANCISDAGWVCVNNNTAPGTWSLGLLNGGQTYLIAEEFIAYSEWPEQESRFKIICPDECLNPTNLSVNLSNSSVEFHWTPQPNQVSWDIEIRPVGTNFTGVPNYFSNQNSLLLTTLATTTRYQWRVRGVCGNLGNSFWTTGNNFFTLPNCNAYPALECGQEVILEFPAGNGYWTNLPNCNEMMVGQEQILQFTTDGPTRYLYFPGNPVYFGFYLKKAGVSACEDVNDWQCVGNSNNNGYVILDNLEPGATYYLLCKKSFSVQTHSLRLHFYCEVPCVPPTNPTMNFIGYSDSYGINVQWEGGNGPWTYQVALRYANGQELIHSNVPWSSGGHNPQNWFTINTSDIHGWRVRSICDNGDTSAWTPYTRFRLPLCGNAIELPCNDTLITVGAVPDHYYYFDICSNNTKIGQQHIYKLSTPSFSNYAYSLKIIPNGAGPMRFARSQSCSPSNQWLACSTISEETLLQLGTLNGGDYLIQLATSDTTAFAPAIEMFCPCNPPAQGKGLIYSDSTANLSWNSTNYADSSVIELVPVGSAFSGNPNYFSTDNFLSIGGLDPAQAYHFRVSNRCGDTGYSAWSDTFSVIFLVDCANLPSPACGDIVTLEIEPWLGLINYNICGVDTKGDEAFFKITPEYTAYYSLEIVGPTFSNNRLYMGFMEDCAHPGTAISCIGNGGFIGTYNLGKLNAGQTYVLVADQSDFINGDGTYELKLNCSLPNDDPGLLSTDSSFLISINDTCRVFSNNIASSNFPDPDPSQAPGNWYDGPEHTVWFKFIAPPGGTVQITAASDPGDPFDPQVALLAYDTLTANNYVLLATGEDNTGPHPADATLIYTGLIPGATYYILVDGANGSSGHFCLTIRDEPDLWLNPGVCQNFVQSSVGFTTSETWRNLYAGGSAHVTGALLGAIRTVDDLGAITISTEILPNVPVLPNGQKILPRYFNIETEFQPLHPLTLRLFFTAADLAAFNIAPPVSSAMPVELGLTHYDGSEEDCDPTNNALAGGLTVSAAQATLVGENGIFYLEAAFNSFSEFGAALAPTISVPVEPDEPFVVSVSPNPFTKDLILRIQSAAVARVNFQLFNLLAGSVSSGSLALQSGQNLEILELGDLAPGMYQLVLYNGGAVLGRVKVVKM